MKEPEKEWFRFIECKECGFVESMPADEQRWDSQSFDFVGCVGSEAVYICPMYNKKVLSYSELVVI